VDGRWRDTATSDLGVEPDHDRMDGTESVHAFVAADWVNTNGPIVAIEPSSVRRPGHQSGH
jgi:hypothetical protein